jgi:hypothetical protein
MKTNIFLKFMITNCAGQVSNEMITNQDKILADLQKNGTVTVKGKSQTLTVTLFKDTNKFTVKFFKDADMLLR